MVIVPIVVGPTGVGKTEIALLLAEEIGAEFPLLLDADGAGLGRVATEKLPRIYLLDPSGSILWFDIEYSESTRRELKNAIHWHLTKKPAVATR